MKEGKAGIKKIKKLQFVPMTDIETNTEEIITEKAVWQIVGKINELVDVVNSLSVKKK